MDRNRHVGPEEGQRLGRPLGVEMPLSNRRPPTPHREKGQVRAPRYFIEPLEEVGIAGEVGVALTLDHETHRLPLPVKRCSSTAVLRRGGPDGDSVEVDGLARCQVDHLLEALPPKQAAATRTTDHQGLPVEGAEARPIEVIEVMMGQEYGIDFFGPLYAP